MIANSRNALCKKVCMTHTFGPEKKWRNFEITINYTNNNLQNIQDTAEDAMA
jgi:hypothetical protein